MEYITIFFPPSGPLITFALQFGTQQWFIKRAKKIWLDFCMYFGANCIRMEYLPELPCFVASITCVPSKRNKYDDPIPFLVYSTSRLSATINRVDWPTYSITKSSWGMSSSALHKIQNDGLTTIYLAPGYRLN